MSDDNGRIKKILYENEHVPFVKRILYPEFYPVLKNDDGSISTHRMAWTSGDGKHFVYPTIMFGEDKKLHEYGAREAWEVARKTGNYIPFNNPEDADWFSKNYKQVWDKPIAIEEERPLP